MESKILIAFEGNAVDDSCIVGVCESSLSDGVGEDNVSIVITDVGIDDVALVGTSEGVNCSCT